jgi:hypothetical protein
LPQNHKDWWKHLQSKGDFHKHLIFVNLPHTYATKGYRTYGISKMSTVYMNNKLRPTSILYQNNQSLKF